jgi:hemolysin activation/secretion protein
LVLGRIGAIRFADPKSSHPSSTNALPASVGDVLNLRDIEQALENFKRVPTAEADIKIEPGKLPGESDLVIEWKQSKSVRYSLGLDDSGSDTTGKRQASATVSVDNPLGLSDLFYLTLNHDAGGGKGLSPKGTQGITLHYSVPMGYWNVSTTASNTSYKQTVEGANENYLYSGRSANAEVKLSRIVYRDATNKTTLTAKLYRKGSQNFIEDTEVEVQRRITSGFEISAAHRLFWGNSTIEGQLTYKQGLKLFGALPAPEEEFDEGTSQFKIISLDASISTPFKVGEQKFKFDSSVKVQRNKTPLISQDRFSIGSRYTVRGFDAKASLAAEKGILLQNTLNWTVPKIDADMYLGVDYGRVSGPATENLVGTSLMGAVLGLRGSFKGLSYDIFVGRPLRKPSELEVGNVYGFNLNYGF